jgi:hypothetical protein
MTAIIGSSIVFVIFQLAWWGMLEGYLNLPYTK